MIYKENFESLPHGLYKIYWKEGGSSLAAVGFLSCGKTWMAPVNWINSNVSTDCWGMVKKVKLIKAQNYDK